MGKGIAVSESKARAVAAAFAVSLLGGMGVASVWQGRTPAKPMRAMVPGLSPEVAKVLHAGLRPGDELRTALKTVYRRDEFQTGEDYLAGAAAFAGSPLPEDQVMAHDFALAAMAQGHPEASAIAVRSLDRLLGSRGGLKVGPTFERRVRPGHLRLLMSQGAEGRAFPIALAARVQVAD